MIRTALLFAFIAFLCGYAFRDWFKALCGLILLMAVIEHPDMPKSIFGVQGLSPWNILMLCTMLGCAVSREKEGLRWDMPTGLTVALIGYVIVILVSYFRMIIDVDGIVEYYRLTNFPVPSKGDLTSEFLINSLKWLVPPALLFYGCNSESRLRFALYSILTVYVLIAIQIIRWMAFDVFIGGEDLSERALRVIAREVGYHRVDASMILAGAFWALLASREYVHSKLWRATVPMWMLVVFVGQALTGGRAGYVTWAAIGFAFALLKWRRYLVLAPVGILLVFMLFPAVKDRLMQGFTEESIDTRGHDVQAEWVGEGDVDAYTVTAGRVIAWPMVVEKIAKSPFLGYGRRAMQREGVATRLKVDLGENFPHPHNAYLQFLFDNGIIGSVPLIFLAYFVVKNAIRLFRNKDEALAVAIGGVNLALLLALAIAAIGSQTFYPREGTVGLWCAMALLIRVVVQESRRRSAG